MIKVFFDQSNPDLIFSIAAIMGSAKGDHVVMVPIDLKDKSDNLLEDKYRAQQRYTIENDTDCLFPNGQADSLFLLNIGPRQVGDDQGFKQFLNDHADEIILWKDNHLGWKQADVAFANKQKQTVIINGVSCLATLEEFGYHSPQWWKNSEEAMLAPAINEITKNENALRYGGAFWVSRVLYRNTEKGSVIDPFREAVEEIISGRLSPEIDRLNALLPNMIRATNQAKDKLSTNAVWFQEAQQNNRPVGYLRLEDVPEYLDIQDIIEHGRSQFPWLFVFEYSFQGQEFLQAASNILDVPEILNYYSEVTKDEDALLYLLNAEVVRFGKK
jgi:hypothetical protein